MKLMSGFLHESLVGRATQCLERMDIPDLTFDVFRVEPRARNTHNPGLSNSFFKLEIYVSDEDATRVAGALHAAIPKTVAPRVQLFVVDVVEILDIN